MWTSALKQTLSDTHLTHELLPVLVPCSSDVIAGSQLLFPTPGVQEVFDVRHGGLRFGELPPMTLKVRGETLLSGDQLRVQVNQSNFLDPTPTLALIT